MKIKSFLQTVFLQTVFFADCFFADCFFADCFFCRLFFCRLFFCRLFFCRLFFCRLFFLQTVFAVGAGDLSAFVEPRLIVLRSRLEFRTVEQSRHIAAVEAGEQIASVGHLTEDRLKTFLVPDGEHVLDVKVATEKSEIVVIDGKGHGSAAALGIDTAEVRTT